LARRGFNFSLVVGEVITTEGVKFRGGHFSAGEHGGTHMDSPYHFNPKGKGMSELTLDQLTGPVVRIDIRDKLPQNLDHNVNMEDINAFEKKHGRIPDGAFVFMFSDWGKRWPNYNMVYNTTDVNNDSSCHFPGFDPDTTSWLIKNRNIRGVGVDTPSTDNAQQQEIMKTHIALGNANIIGLENIDQMDKLPPTGATVILAVMRSVGGTGAPTRVIAILPKGSTVTPDKHDEPAKGAAGAKQGSRHTRSVVDNHNMHKHMHY